MDVSRGRFGDACSTSSHSGSSMSRAPKRPPMCPLRYAQILILTSLVNLARQVPEFISQRRRWLNGSLFASIHATVFFYKIWSSGHNVLRKFILQMEFIYNAIQLLFTWTSLANFYLAFFFVSAISVHGSVAHLALSSSLLPRAIPAPMRSTF